MVDPTSDLGEDVAEDEAPNCRTCNEPIVNEPTHRVITWVEDGEVQSQHFCNERCRLDWDGSN